MNNVIMVGTLDGDAELVYENNDHSKSLYKFKLLIPKPFKNKKGTLDQDVINVKVWSGSLEDEAILHDQANIAIEGRIQSYPSKDLKIIYNEVLALKVYYLA